MSFAFKIDKALKANLYKICRLCGIDREEKFEILDEDDTVDQQPLDCDGELTLHQKIIQCIGITVCKDDKMPQSACGLCVDKINDFYEFREMCYATDVQTRKLLGLKGESQKKIVNLDVKPIIDIKEETGAKRGRKRKPEEPIVRLETTEVKRETNPIGNITKKLRLNEPLIETKKKGKLGKQVDKTLKPFGYLEIKEEPVEAEKSSITSSNITKFRQTCSICSERFGSKLKLDQHVAANHVPSIPRYYCTACNETIKKTNDIKSHQLWHKLSKSPYMCGHCGQLLTSSYMYSRHLRDHTVEIPPNLWILDRECPQCHQTFITNYLYNTHPCAVRTKKCAGCNRQLRNELEYQRHAAHCAKVYLSYSKHIPAAAVAAESAIRIKNENDVEAAAAEALAQTAGLTLDMAPIVSLTRISTPDILAASQGKDLVDYSSENAIGLTEEGKTPLKKGTKKGVSRKDLKRVDNLLKSTLDALVSIKHEPEVHVEIEGETPSAATANKDDELSLDDEDHFNQDDDFHHGDDDDDDEDNNVVGSDATVKTSSANIGIKQEPVEDGVAQNSTNVKQEVIGVDNGNPLPVTKMPVLKLKIKKEHGTLNSSIVEVEGDRAEKKKKKKKRKETERSRDKTLDINEHAQENPTKTLINTEENSNILRPIKQERLDETDEDDEGNKTDTSEAIPTVMTTIPIPQFQISAISSGVEFGATTACGIESSDVGVGETTAPSTLQTNRDEEEVADVKPNKAKLDRLFEITSVSCGVQMEHELESETDKDRETEYGTEDTISATERIVQEPSNPHIGTNVGHNKSPISTAKVAKHKPVEQKSQPTRLAKAFKSTSGVNKPSISGDAESNTFEFSNMHIKPEPVDRGYEDVYNAYESATNSSATETENTNEGLSIRDIAEQEYLNNIDFSNIQIKQEKDLDVADVEITNTHIVANAIPNGMRRSNGEKSQYTDDDSTDSTDNSETDYDDDEDDDDEDGDGNGNDDWVGVKQEDEKREYREIELPALLSTENHETTEENTNNVHQSRSHNDEDINGLSSSEKHSSCELTKATTSTLMTEGSQNSPSPFIISSVYCQAKDGEKEINNAKPILPVEAEVQYTQGLFEPPDEVSTLKIANVLSGCSVSFNDLPKPDHLLTENSSATWVDEPMEVGDVTAGGTSRTTELPNSLHTKTQQHSPVEAMDIPQALETMCLEINQGKELLLDAQPFVDASVETFTAIDTTQMPISSNVNMGVEMALHSTAHEDLVEEAQNMLNQEVVEAQATRRLTLGAATTRIHTLAEETENLMNESVAAAQRQEQQATVTTGGNVVYCGSGSSSNSGEIDRTSRSTVFNNPFMLDDSNINEIAENHNNANIERELQDDIGATTNAANASEPSENATTRQADAEVTKLNMNEVT